MINNQSRPKAVIGNWKMNGSLQQNAELVNGLIEAQQTVDEGTDIVICPPSCFIAQCQQLLESNDRIQLGGQNVSEFNQGAYTGEVSADMLIQLNCQYVLIGHSERRALFAETDEVIAKKCLQSIEKGLKVVLCVGETQQQYDNNETQAVIHNQLTAVLNILNDDHLEQLIVAYEPVWAIGTGKTATPEIAQSVHQSIRKIIQQKSVSISERIMILYGGSVKADNAASLFQQPDIDGGLIGGASLQAEDFISICRAI